MLKTNIKKYAAIFFAIVLMGTASGASAQTTTAQLQQQLNQLLATVAALQAQLAAMTGGSTATCTMTFTRNLGIGASGADVLALQKFLNRDAATRLAGSGAGSPGFETQFYGPVTANAVSRFQAKYAGEILAPLGLTSPTGYFGASSRAKANALCTVVIPPSNGGGGTTTPPSGALKGGEASLANFDAREGDDTVLNEGQDNGPVMDATFDVRDGDVRIDRADVAFTHVQGGDDKPWDVFDTVSLWDGNHRIAEMDANNRADWNKDEPNNGDYTLRFSNLDYIVREGDEADITVAVTVAGSVDEAGDVTWETFIPDQGIRATDSLGLSHYIGDENDAVSFDINERGSQDELTVRTSSEDPESSVLQLDANNRSDWMTVFAFDLDTGDSNNDIQVNEIPVDVTLGSGTWDDLVDDAELVVDGTTYTDFNVENGNTDSPTLTFDFSHQDLTIDAGDRVTAELRLRFNALPSAQEGTTLEASVNADNIDAEGADDLGSSQLSGNITSEQHVLRTQGGSASNVKTTAKLVESGDVERGEFTVQFDVTAFDSDIYVNRSAASGTSMGTAGVNYVVEESDGDTASGGSVSGALSSNATVTGGRYVVREGQTRTFTLSVSYDPDTTNFYRVQLYSLNYNDTNADPDTQQRALPAQDYETDVISIRG
jgi:peptidoglycan hydrolase-like protein with peptidoglycan-binding domain